MLPPRTSSYGAPTAEDARKRGGRRGNTLAPASTTAAGEPPPHASETLTPTEALWHPVGITSTAAGSGGRLDDLTTVVGAAGGARDVRLLGRTALRAAHQGDSSRLPLGATGAGVAPRHLSLRDGHVTSPDRYLCR
uniref:Uncharacterized protein n=1 Tax=Nonomuraea gerenzanensis TaxID=93944 RepID=A0A1M4EP78_9ACTN|nr:hypothetical protein BN4615_P9909 [Nonomuraea gerenzanensis]